MKSDERSPRAGYIWFYCTCGWCGWRVTDTDCEEELDKPHVKHLVRRTDPK
jgi:hypothetical protein